ncbi:MAG: hypothetical protein K2H76_02550 [Muribaculaceae bacterium]|nr:hypothetical protein [Muribaculaceae bacterium]
MKLQNNLLIALGGCLMMTSPFSLQAGNDDPKKDTTVSQTIVVSKKKEVHPYRPKTPSRQSIECIYSDETLYVSFFIPEGECTMTVTDAETGLSLQYLFPTEETAEIYVGSLNAAYFEFETEAGHAYEGWLGE